MKLVAKPITAAEFEPFGDVITAPETYGRQTFTDGLAHDARPFVLSTTHTKSSEMPLTVDRLERHTHSSQTFLPLEVQRWLVVVSTTSESSSLRAFVVPGTTGITIDRPGHLALLAYRTGPRRWVRGDHVEERHARRHRMGDDHARHNRNHARSIDIRARCSHLGGRPGSNPMGIETRAS